MKTKLLFFIIFSFFNYYSFSQLPEDGTYVFENNEVKLTIEVIESGYKVVKSKLYFKSNKKESISKGEWFQVNEHGVDEDYKGPFGWYQIIEGVYKYDIELELNKNIILINSRDKFISKNKFLTFKSYSK